MRVLVCSDAQKVGAVAATYVAEGLRGKEEPIIGLATGSSPLSLYQELAAMVEAGELDLSSGYGFALDEYVGIPVEHEQSYHQVIHRTVTLPLRMRPERVRVPNGQARDLLAAAAEYDSAIGPDGVDVQVLGIGSNGHIGFNEPGSPFDSLTRVVDLTERTRTDNARFFDSIDQVPTQAMTQGLAPIVRSKRAVLVALGEKKSEAVRAFIAEDPSEDCPASILQGHPDLIVVLDEGAAKKLSPEHFLRI